MPQRASGRHLLHGGKTGHVLTDVVSQREAENDPTANFLVGSLGKSPVFVFGGAGDVPVTAAPLPALTCCFFGPTGS